jgi:hypothetical protein
MTGGGKKEQPVATPGSDVAVAVAGDQNTGFDLYVVPGGVTTWRLDGESRTDKLPSRIRGISPGPHTVSIDAPPGFMSQNQPITVDAGKAPKVEIALKPIEGISGDFDSTPPGATVSLFIDGKRESLGASPAKAPLDPRKTYQVLFEKTGYVSVNRPIVFTGSLDEKIMVNLEKAGAAVADAGSASIVPPVVQNPVIQHPVTNNGGSHPITQPGGDKSGGDKSGGDKSGGDKSGGDKSGGDKSGGDKPAAGGQGTLLVGSKPPCDIFIDGSSTGLHTPAKDIKLAAGKHKVTLVNTEFGIRDTFTVDIKADQPEKAIKDYSDKINK